MYVQMHKLNVHYAKVFSKGKMIKGIIVCVVKFVLNVNIVINACLEKNNSNIKMKNKWFNAKNVMITI